MKIFPRFSVPLTTLILSVATVVAGCGGAAGFGQDDSAEERNAVHEWAIRNNSESIAALDVGDRRINEGDENGWTPLHWAAALNNPDALVELLLKGADPNARAKGDGSRLGDSAFRVFNEFGMGRFFDEWLNEADPVLMAAVYSDNPNVIAALIRSGADVNSSSSNLVTPLHEAVGVGFFNSVVGLANGGANLEARDNLGATPLHWAAFSNSPEIVADLVRRGVNPNVHAGLQETPLHWAAKNNAVNAAFELIGWGANPNAPDDLGFTPLDWALEQDNHFAASLLRQNGGMRGEDLPQ